MSQKFKKSSFSYLSMCSCCNVVSKYSVNVKKHLQQQHSGEKWRKEKKLVIPVRISSRYEKCIHRSLDNVNFAQKLKKTFQTFPKQDSRISKGKDVDSRDKEDVPDFRKFILCPVCNMLFASFEHFSKHIKLPDHEVTFRCKKCSGMYSLFKDLEVHYKNSHPGSTFISSPMEYIRVTKTDVQNMETDNELFCPYCPLIFKEHQLSSHIRIAHFNQIKISTVKHEIGGSRAAIEASIVEYRCPHCPNDFHSVADIAKHIFDRHVISSQSKTDRNMSIQSVDTDHNVDFDHPEESDLAKEESERVSSRKRKAPKWLQDANYELNRPSKTTKVDEINIQAEGKIRSGKTPAQLEQKQAVTVTRSTLQKSKVLAEEASIELSSKKEKAKPQTRIKQQTDLKLDLEEVRKGKADVRVKLFGNKQTPKEKITPDVVNAEKDGIKQTRTRKAASNLESPSSNLQDNKIKETRSRKASSESPLGVLSNLKQSRSRKAASNTNESSSNVENIVKQTRSRKMASNSNESSSDVECNVKQTRSRTVASNTSAISSNMRSGPIEKSSLCTPVKVELTKIDAEKPSAMKTNVGLSTSKLQNTKQDIKVESDNGEDEEEFFGDSDDDYKPEDDTEDGDDYQDEFNKIEELRCPHCIDKVYITMGGLNKHMNKVHGGNALGEGGSTEPRKTASQRELFKKEKILKNFALEVVGDKYKVIKYKCPYCYFYLYHKDYVISHVQHAHPEVRNFLPFDIIVEEVLVEKDFDRELFKCHKCSYEVKWKKQMRCHMSSCFGTGYRDVDIPCLLPRAYTLKRLSASKLICPLCKSVKNGKDELEKHMKEDHLQATTCDVQLRSSLSEPQPVEKKLKDHFCFMCPLCIYVARRKDFIQDHLTSHKNDNNRKSQIIKCVLLAANASQEETLQPEVDDIQSKNDQNVGNNENKAKKLSADNANNQTHERARLQEGTYVCPLCEDYVTMIKEDAVKHVLDSHSEHTQEFFIHYILPDVVIKDDDSDNGEDGNRGKLMCNTCGYSGNTLLDLVKHSRINSNHQGFVGGSETKLKPKKPHTGYMGLFEIVTHQGVGVEHLSEKENVAGAYKCSVCENGFPYATKKGLMRHLKAQHKDKAILDTYQCVFQMRDVIAGGVERSYTCSVCSEEVNTEGKLKDHFKAFHESMVPELEHELGTIDNELECQVCFKLLEDLPGLHRHLLLHVNQWQPHCPVCGMWFEKQQDADHHVATYHSDTAKICYVCGKTFVNLRAYHLHVKQHEKESSNNTEDPSSSEDTGRRLCQWCGTSILKYNYKKHLLRNHWQHLQCDCDICKTQIPPANKKSQQCDVCELIICSRSALRAHRWSKHPDKYKPPKRSMYVAETVTADSIKEELLEQVYQPDVQIEDCSVENIHRTVMKIDMSAERPYGCKLCGKACSKKKLLYRHVRRCHMKEDNKKYRCSVCQMRFDQLSELSSHARCHRKTRSFQCRICGKAYKLLSQLNLHARVHSTDEPMRFPCGYCDRIFTQDTKLHNHVVWHDKLKPFKCVICEKGFTTSHNLLRHMSKHSVSAIGNQVKCYCKVPMQFPDFRTLGKHVLTHFPKYPFECSVCKKKLPTFRRLYTHKAEMKHFTDAEREQGKNDPIPHTVDSSIVQSKLVQSRKLTASKLTKLHIAGPSAQYVQKKVKHPTNDNPNIVTVEVNEEDMTGVVQKRKTSMDRHEVQAMYNIEPDSEGTVVHLLPGDTVYTTEDAASEVQEPEAEDYEITVSNVNNIPTVVSTVSGSNASVLANVDLITSILAQSEPGRAQTFQMPDGSFIHVIVQK